MQIDVGKTRAARNGEILNSLLKVRCEAISCKLVVKVNIDLI